MALLKHIGSTTAAAVFSALCGIALLVFSSRLLGVHGRGEVALVLNAANLAYPLTTLGIRQATAYYIGKHNVPLVDVLGAQAFVLPLAGVLTTVGAVVVLWTSDQVALTFAVTAWLLASVASRIAFDYLSGLFLAQVRIYELNLVTIVRASLELTLVAAALFMQATIVSYLAGSMVAYTAATCLALWFVLCARTARWEPCGQYIKNLIAIASQLARKGVTFALPLFIMGLNFGIDVAMLGALSGATDVGLYSVAITFVNALWFLPNIVNLVVFSHAVNVPREEVDAYSRELFRNCMKVMLIMLPVVVLLGLTARQVIEFAFGTDFGPAAASTVALLPGGYLMAIFKMLNADLSARGRPEVALRSFSIALCVNVLLNLYLIRAYGHVGAAVASTISYSLGAILYLVAYLRITRAHSSGTDLRSTGYVTNE